VSDPVQSSVLGKFFAGLDRADVEGCAELLAKDVQFSRLGIDRSKVGDSQGASKLDTTVGREAMIELLRNRGTQPYTHELVRGIVTKDYVVAEGIIITKEGATAMVFLSQAQLDAEGRIARYITLSQSLTPTEAEAIGYGAPR